MKNNLLQFKQISAFSDNYLWAIIQNDQAWVVDPGDAAPIIQLFEQEGICLKGILVTHHHQDHIGGLTALCEWAKSKNNVFQTLGPSHPNIHSLDHLLKEGDCIEIFSGVSIQCMEVPGHTLTHLAYFLPQSELNPIPRLYCGDTLFAAGCGRLFEGSPQQMYESLQKFAQLPNETLVCCAHEYTLSNIKFAKFIDPDNKDLVKWMIEAENLRNMNQPTVPTSLGLEKLVNPFMRCDQGSIIQAAKQSVNHVIDSPVQVLAAIRKMKDSF